MPEQIKFSMQLADETGLDDGDSPVIYSAIDVKEYESIVAELNVSAKTGTLTLDAKLQHSIDGNTWEDLVSFTQLTDVGKESKKAFDFYPLVRLYVTIGGTTPTVDYDVSIMLMTKPLQSTT